MLAIWSNIRARGSGDSGSAGIHILRDTDGWLHQHSVSINKLAFESRPAGHVQLACRNACAARCRGRVIRIGSFGNARARDFRTIGLARSLAKASTEAIRIIEYIELLQAKKCSTNRLAILIGHAGASERGDSTIRRRVRLMICRRIRDAAVSDSAAAAHSCISRNPSLSSACG